jgi:hypothetical protein
LLRRTRSSICRKAARLRIEGVLAPGPKHLDAMMMVRKSLPLEHLSPPLPSDPGRPDATAMRPCTLLELDRHRCHWPLGDVYEMASLFCGRPTSAGQCYCPQHRRIAAKN